MIKYLIFGYLLIVGLYAKLWLVSDDQKCTDLKDKNIEYTLANFGHNPYGSTLYGFLSVSSEANSELCNL